MFRPKAAPPFINWPYHLFTNAHRLLIITQARYDFIIVKQFAGIRPERPTEGRIVLGGGFTEPLKAVEAAAGRMHFPGEQPEIVPVAFEWAMENPGKFAALLADARYLGDSASAVTLSKAKEYARDPGSLGLIEAVMIAGVEPRPDDALVMGYFTLMVQQAGAAWKERGTAEEHIDAGLIRAKLGELATRPQELARLQAIHNTSSMAVLTGLALRNIPVVAAYVDNDAFGFRAPEGLQRERFVQAGGILMQLGPYGHEADMEPNPDKVLRQVYPHLAWPRAGEQA